jgi:hypothetical protein
MPTPPHPLAPDRIEEGGGLQSAAPSEVAEYIEDMLSGMESLARRSRLDRLGEILALARTEARRVAAN